MTEIKHLDRPGEPRLAYEVSVPAGARLGRVLMVHGYAEHSARYDGVAGIFRDAGLVVARFDLRGHGRSSGIRGHVVAFDDYVRDVRAVLDLLDEHPAWRGERAPVLFGHSLGGLIATHSALSFPDRFVGLALTSPFYGIAQKVPAWQLTMGKLVARVVPTLKQASGLKGADLTHDESIVQAYDRDPLHFDHVTVGWFTQITQAQELVVLRAPQMRLPVFCIAGGDDRIVSVDAIRRAFDLFRSKDKELDVKPGLFHEVLNELDWRDHAGRLAERMVRWSGG